MNELELDHPVDVAFESQGVIRDNFVAGTSGIQAFSDAYRVLPLGEGFDGRPGYPMVSFYVTGNELSAACEVTASVSPIYGCSYYIEHSGMRCTYDNTQAMFYKMQTVELWNEDTSAWEVIDSSAGATTLYRIAVDSYVASLMDVLGELTFGILSITPKEADGTPHTDIYDSLVDTDPDTAGGQELKLWETLITYAASFPDTTGDGIPDIPASYETPEGRMVAQ
jgi:5'-nucleotidase/UDP-sugar diphosphatase